MSGPASFLTLDHLVIRCADIERMSAFYETVLGCRRERVLDDLGLYQFRAGSCLIDLVDIDKAIGKGPAPDPANPNMAHFCLRIEDTDWDGLIGYFRDKGVDIDDAPGRRYGADGQGQSIYLRDPEGNVLELKMSPEPGSVLAGS